MEDDGGGPWVAIVEEAEVLGKGERLVLRRGSREGRVERRKCGAAAVCGDGLVPLVHPEVGSAFVFA